MKRILALLFFLTTANNLVHAQLSQVKIVSLTVKNQLPVRIDDWANTPGALLMVAQSVPGARIRELKLVIQIRSNGSVVCGNMSNNGMAVGDLTTRTFTTSELTGTLAGCRELKEGSYTLCAQFFNIDKVAVSQEICREFRVETPKAVDYSKPGNLFPADKAIIRPKDARIINFKWTPVVPPPPNRDIVYRLRVWQLMQGQNPTQAMRSNPPVVNKEVNNQLQAVISDLYTGPCKPPYLCDFVWTVQATSKEGNPYGDNNGTSEPTVFKIGNNIDTQIDSVFVSCCEKGKQSIYLSVKNNLANAVNIVAVKYKINGVGASITLSPITPNPVVLIPGNGTQVFTASINCIDNLSSLKFLVDAEDVADPDNKETEVSTYMLNCRCSACDSVKITLPGEAASTLDATGNTLIMNTTISVSPKPVKSIKAELVYFEYKPESEDCMLCNKDSKTFGNFVSAQTGNQPVGLPWPHAALWNSNQPNGQSITNAPLQFSISLPPTIKCCAANIKWCIRYIVTFADCTVCNTLVCYSYIKKCDCK
jgi:hypothetical protein